MGVQLAVHVHVILSLGVDIVMALPMLLKVELSLSSIGILLVVLHTLDQELLHQPIKNVSGDLDFLKSSRTMSYGHVEIPS